MPWDASRLGSWPPPSGMSPSTSATEVVDVSQLHVLMVDDEQISRTVACNLLRKVGYSVSAFATGAAALAALQDPQLRKVRRCARRVQIDAGRVSRARERTWRAGLGEGGGGSAMNGAT